MTCMDGEVCSGDVVEDELGSLEEMGFCSESVVG